VARGAGIILEDLDTNGRYLVGVQSGAAP
jgi:hypothetical protein